MKKIILALFLISTLSYAQTTNTDLDLGEVKVANSPTLALTDNTCSIITSNVLAKEFSLNTENLQNLSFEFTPMIFTDKSKLRGLKFYGVTDKNGSFSTTPFYRITRPTFSGALNRNDSTATAAIGINWNLISIHSVSAKKLKQSYSDFREKVQTITVAANSNVGTKFPALVAGTPAYNAQLKKEIEALTTEIPNDFNEAIVKPAFTLDLASAYSLLFPTNQYNKSQTDRFGVWMTAAGSIKLGKASYVNFYAFTRYLEDNSIYNPTSLTYSDKFHYTDFGGKFQFDLNRFSIGYEYIKRNGDGKDFRSVGMVQYKVNTNLFITGGFGKNFDAGKDNNVLTLIGINWGFNRESQIKWE